MVTGKGLYFFPVLLAAALSCSSLDKNRNEVKESVVIRYFSIQAVYNSIAERNGELKSAAGVRDNLLKSVKNLEEQLLLAADKKNFFRTLQDEREKLEKAEKEISFIKSKIYNNIYRALRITAEYTGADFILNIGDELLYSKKKYDITDEIIREMNKIEFRSQPANR